LQHGHFHIVPNLLPVKVAQNFFLEEGRIHAHFDSDPGHLFSHFGHAISDHVQGSTFGVVDVAGSISDLEKVSCLRHMAKKGKVTLRMSVVRIVTTEGPPHRVTARKNSSIEVQRDGSQSNILEFFENKL